MFMHCRRENISNFDSRSICTFKSWLTLKFPTYPSPISPSSYHTVRCNHFVLFHCTRIHHALNIATTLPNDDQTSQLALSSTLFDSVTHASRWFLLDASKLGGEIHRYYIYKKVGLLNRHFLKTMFLLSRPHSLHSSRGDQMVVEISVCESSTWWPLYSSKSKTKYDWWAEGFLLFFELNTADCNWACAISQISKAYQPQLHHHILHRIAFDSSIEYYYCVRARLAFTWKEATGPRHCVEVANLPSTCRTVAVKL